MIVSFEEHNGTSAKKRCQTAKRVANHAANNADKTPVDTETNADSVSGALAREEKRREESKEISNLSVATALPAEEAPTLALVGAKPKVSKPPDCPHLDVLALWGEVLPAMPQHLPSQWRGSRADHLRARWRETAAEKGWVAQEEGIEHFRRLFAYVGRSPFLTGRSKPKSADRKPFFIELEWLVNQTNWAKVLEGKYHQEAA